MKMNFNLDRPKPTTLTDSIRSKIFNKNINYYVCSSGGCGSTILSDYLRNFGNVFHIHDRYPPNNLCFTGEINTNEPVYREWFNKTEISTDNLNKYKVIFIYRNPIEVINSRFALSNGPNIQHMKNIKCINDGNIYFGDILNTEKDLYGLEEFFDNYTVLKERNYEIYCIKYELLFNNMKIFNAVLEIPDIKELYPTKLERKKTYTYLSKLNKIYFNLINKMNNMPFIKVIPKLK